MCGRYTIAVTMQQLMMFYQIEEQPNDLHLPRFNVAPTQLVPAIIHDGIANRLGSLRWGLVPSWAKDEKIGSKMINARAETVAEKPAFKKLIAHKRCIIPADGFYEWKQGANGKQPMRITLRSGQLFAMAGLYDTWLSPSGEKLHTCTIITTEPNKLVAEIHNRMPVILHPEAEQQWLDRKITNVQRLLPLLEPYPEEIMRAYPVSKNVGNVGNDNEQLILELDEPATMEQGRLF